MKNNLVSIIIPTYNSEKFLEETILSIMNQSYQNIEIIIIDGCSKDGTIDIINKYKNHLGYFISEKDSGQSNAINKGFKVAKGDIVTWLGSDDVLYTDTVKIIVEEFNKNENIGLVYGDVDVFDANSVVYHKHKFKLLSVDYLLNVNQGVPQPGSFYRAKFVERIGYLDENLHQVMDYDLFLKLLKISRGVYVNKSLAKFRMHESNKSTYQGPYKSPIEGFKVGLRHGGKLISKNNYNRFKRLIKYLIKRV